MHMWFGPGLFFAPFVLFWGILRVLLLVGLVVLLVRVFAHHSRDHGAWHRHPAHWSGVGDDPRRVAAMRYAAGRIDRDEYERILHGLDSAEQQATSV